MVRALKTNEDELAGRIGHERVAELMNDASTDFQYLGAECIFVLTELLKQLNVAEYRGVVFVPADSDQCLRDSEHTIVLKPHDYYKTDETTENGEFLSDARNLYLLLTGEGTSSAHFTLIANEDDAIPTEYLGFMEKCCYYDLGGTLRRGLLWPQKGATTDCCCVIITAGTATTTTFLL